MGCKPKTFPWLLFILLLWACPVAAPAVTPPLPAQPSRNVMDLAGVIDAATEARLNAMLHDLEAKTTAQVVVLTVNSLDGEPIEDFSHQTAVKWGIGQKGKDNGVLITVAVKDHKYRLEVGYGLESTLPDSLVGSLGRQYLVPNFKKGDYAGGLLGAATEISKKIAASQGVAIANIGNSRPTVPKEIRRPGRMGMASQFTVFLLIAFVILLFSAIFSRKKRGGRSGGFWFFGGSGGGWSSGGGGDSGFSGGGGDFGGGGASGDW